MPGCLLVQPGSFPASQGSSILSIASVCLQYARSKHVESRKRRQLFMEAAGLEAPLLDSSTAGAAGTTGEPTLPPLYSLWWSKLFWSGVVLLMLSAGLAALTVYTVLYPLPADA